MQQLLTGRKRVPGFDDRWRKYLLGDIFSRQQRPVTVEKGHGYRLISIRRRAGGLFERGIFDAKDIAYTELHPIRTNDFLISKRQVTHGALAVVPEKFDGAFVSNEYTIFTLTKGVNLYMPFFHWLTQQRELWHLAYISSDGVHIEKLIFKPKDFLKHTIKLPSSASEQHAIAKILTTANEEIELLETKHEQFKEQKKGLMQKLLTGQVRVKT